MPPSKHGRSIRRLDDSRRRELGAAAAPLPRGGAVPAYGIVCARGDGGVPRGRCCYEHRAQRLAGVLAALVSVLDVAMLGRTRSIRRARAMRRRCAAADYTSACARRAEGCDSRHRRPRSAQAAQLRSLSTGAADRLRERWCWRIRRWSARRPARRCCFPTMPISTSKASARAISRVSATHRERDASDDQTVAI